MQEEGGRGGDYDLITFFHPTGRFYKTLNLFKKSGPLPERDSVGPDAPIGP